MGSIISTIRRLFYLAFGSKKYSDTTAFETQVSNAAFRERIDTIENFDTSSAIFVMSTIYERAAKEKKRIRHISNKFESNIYDDDRMVSALESCIVSNIRLQYIINAKDGFYSNNGRFANLLKQSNQVEIVISSKALNPMVVVGDDGKMYRYETDPVAHTGVVSFNHPFVGIKFIKYFDKKFANTEKYLLTHEKNMDE